MTKQYKNIPKVAGLPILGNALDLVTTNLNPFLVRCYLDHGSVFKVTALNRELVVLAGTAINQFTTKEGHKYLRSKEAWRGSDIEFGAQKSLISSDGEEHRAFRKAEGRAYTRSFLFANLHKAVAVAAADISTFSAGQVLPVPWICKLIVTEQLARVVTNSSIREGFADFVEYIQTVLMVKVTSQLPPLMLYSPKYQKSKAKAFKMVDDLIQYHRDNPPTQTPENPNGRHADLIDDMLAAWANHPEWSHGDVRIACLGAFIAGMDTAANALAFVMYRLYQHPQYLPDIQKEVDELFANGVPEGAQMKNMKHLYHFIMETLRLHPIAPAITRNLTQDLHYQDYLIPKDTQVIIATTLPHGLHELFPEPERFDPTRFERGEHRQAGAYAPFGLGAHVCAGSGMAEGLIMLNTAALLYTLELENDPNYVLKQVARPTPSPDKNFKLRVRRVRNPAVQLIA